MMYDISKEFLDYIEYLEANGLTLNENGEEVPKDEGPKLTLGKNNDEE